MSKVSQQNSGSKQKDAGLLPYAQTNRKDAWEELNRIIGRLSEMPHNRQTDMLFVSSSLELADISFVLGKNFRQIADILSRAVKAAKRIGDRRSQALIELHLGRLYYFSEQHEEALLRFEKGKAIVEELGDEDIMIQAAEFIGLYYFFQGRFKNAIEYFEKAAKSFESESGDRLINPSGPIWLSYCAAFLGRFNRAIGMLDYYRRFAQKSGEKAFAATLRAVLGIILLGIGKSKEAHFHLSGAFQEAMSMRNALAGYFAKGGLAIHHFMEGRIRQAGEWIRQAVTEGAAAGLVHQYASPIVLEILFGLKDKEEFQDPDFNFENELARVLNGINIHLRGVALRLVSGDKISHGLVDSGVIDKLSLSESLLEESGDTVQLGKTRVELARAWLCLGDRKKAEAMATAARRDFGSYEDIFFPEDLRPLLTIKPDRGKHAARENDILDVFARAIYDIPPDTDFESMLERTVKASIGFFGAERGGIFWFERDRKKSPPRLRGACNLLASDTRSPLFKESLALVFSAYYENRPKIIRKSSSDFDPTRIKSVLCVPFSVNGHPRGVLYHDTSYVRDYFDLFDETQLLRMAQWLTGYINRIFAYSKKIEESAAGRISFLEPAPDAGMIFESPVMRKLIEQADRIAATDSTVLILGETGVGKELLARRIHRFSRRKNRPMVVLDPTVISENLVESELFGHEKGAFTGADRQKSGRIELAHKGTLFIDEIGEIPKPMQTKLLRAIQEKTMTRVGGNKTIVSDFRLIAATNRDLPREVEAGRFREDLFYRLNVIPITIPPLRERTEDILPLARHFLARFSAKYNRPGLFLTSRDEQMLIAYDWPGNIRELENIIERAVLLSPSGEFHLNLPEASDPGMTHPFDGLPSLDELQRRYIRHVLKLTGGRIAGPGGAAEILGMKRTSLYNRMKRLGLR